MKAELRIAPHTVLNASVIEVWYGGKLVCTVTGADGPGIRIISKHVVGGKPSVKVEETKWQVSPGVVEVMF